MYKKLTKDNRNKILVIDLAHYWNLKDCSILKRLWRLVLKLVMKQF